MSSGSQARFDEESRDEEQRRLRALADRTRGRGSGRRYDSSHLEREGFYIKARTVRCQSSSLDQMHHLYAVGRDLRYSVRSCGRVGYRHSRTRGEHDPASFVAVQRGCNRTADVSRGLASACRATRSRGSRPPRESGRGIAYARRTRAATRSSSGRF